MFAISESLILLTRIGRNWSFNWQMEHMWNSVSSFLWISVKWLAGRARHCLEKNISQELLARFSMIVVKLATKKLLFPGCFFYLDQVYYWYFWSKAKKYVLVFRHLCCSTTSTHFLRTISQMFVFPNGLVLTYSRPTPK